MLHSLSTALLAHSHKRYTIPVRTWLKCDSVSHGRQRRGRERKEGGGEGGRGQWGLLHLAVDGREQRGAINGHRLHHRALEVELHDRPKVACETERNGAKPASRRRRDGRGGLEGRGDGRDGAYQGRGEGEGGEDGHKREKEKMGRKIDKWRKGRQLAGREGEKTTKGTFRGQQDILRRGQGRPSRVKCRRDLCSGKRERVRVRAGVSRMLKEYTCYRVLLATVYFLGVRATVYF